MKLKILPILCAAVLLTTTTVHANTTISESDLINNSKDVDVKVTAEISSTFTVSLPATIELTENGSNYTYSGSVGVKGDIDSGHNVYVVPSTDITMNDITARPEGILEYEGYMHKDPVQGTVNQSETSWNYVVLSSGASSGNFTYDADTQYYNTSLTVTTPKLSAGDWEGILTYDILLAADLPLKAGLYGASDNLLVTWEDSGIDVSINYTNSNYKTSTTSGYYVLTNNYPTATKVVIPDSVTSIGDYAFARCTGLESVTIPDSITSIGDRAFYICTGLESVTIPDSVTSIDVYAFAECSGLTLVTIPNSVTNIVNGVFANCKSLTSVTIPDSVTSIGAYAFSDCTNLTSVAFNTTSGWYIGSSAGAKTTALNSFDLANTSIAATHLKTTYSDEYWTRV